MNMDKPKGCLLYTSKEGFVKPKIEFENEKRWQSQRMHPKRNDEAIEPKKD